MTKYIPYSTILYVGDTGIQFRYGIVSWYGIPYRYSGTVLRTDTPVWYSGTSIPLLVFIIKLCSNYAIMHVITHTVLPLVMNIYVLNIATIGDKGAEGVNVGNLMGIAQL